MPDLIKIACCTILCLATQMGHAYPVQGTFLNFYRNLTPEQWNLEFRAMKDVDIQTIVVLSIGHLRSDSADPLGFSLAADGLLYPSKYLSPSEQPTQDRLEMILSLADQYSMDVLLGSLQTESAWTDGTEFIALREYNRRVAAEILQRYGQHRSLKGWYFTQEVWMNWVKYYGGSDNAPAYYGTRLMANWVADIKSLDSSKMAAASIVVKKSADGPMPALIAIDVQRWTTSLLHATSLDILMPQDGIGAQSGAPSIQDLPSYYRAMAVGAIGTHAILWDILETFTAVPGLGGEQYPPADIHRIQKQIDAVRPYVTGYVSWIFGDDMSPEATYYPLEAAALNQQYKCALNQQTTRNYARPNNFFVCAKLSSSANRSRSN